MLLEGRIKEEFGLQVIYSPEVERVLEHCARIYAGQPDWLDPQEEIKTINFAQTLCSETARLATLAIGIKVDGSQRAQWLQEQLNKVYFQLRHWVEYGCAFGTVILKPDDRGNIELYTKGNFEITHQTGDKIDGAVFLSRETVGKKHYIRFESHSMMDGICTIENRCFVGDSDDSATRPVAIEKTPWADLEETVSIITEKPLFAVLRMPQANNISVGSPWALPMFAGSLEELRDLDVAYSRNSTEIDDSRRVVLLDADTMLSPGKKVNNTAASLEQRRQAMKLPKYINNIQGNSTESLYHEINPSLNTEERLKGINSLLSQIGFKCGYSNGYFVFNEKTGMVTATQVESDDRRTIQLIKDVRDKLESCMDDLIYALSAFADLYDLAPLGEYETTYSFGDIIYSYEQDKATWYGYVIAGKIPFWYYLTKFEGLSEEEAKALEAAAAPKEPTLFGGEE